MSDDTPRTPDLPTCIIDDRWSDTTVILCCSGVLDMLTAPLLEAHIAAALKKKPTAMIIDLTGVEFLASAGMGVLIATHNTVPADTMFSVVADGPITSRPMRLIGLDKLIDIHPTLDIALHRLSAPPAIT